MPSTTQILYALLGTGFTFLATALGSATVFFFKKDINPNLQKAFLGFAAGIMISASVWSLLIPAIDIAKEAGQNPLLHASIGFILGGLFLLFIDKLIPHLHLETNEQEGLPANFKRSTMLVLAVTLHNIPEGISVAIAFSAGAITNNFSVAFALALGMALQNFPEGMAISLPLKKEGFSNKKAFLYGAFSGIVEPIAGIIAVFLISQITYLMPITLSFAAGAMIYVVVEELIPEASLDKHSHIGTFAVMSGFLAMLILDIGLS